MGKLSYIPRELIYEAVGTGTQTLTNTPALVALDTNVQANSSFTNVGGVVTYTGDERQFLVIYNTSGFTNTNRRSTGVYGLYINGTLLTRSVSYSYHRLNADRDGSTSRTLSITLQPGDTIELRANDNNNDNVNLYLDRTTLLIMEV